MLRFINGLFDRLFAIVGGLLFSQFPAFMEQYMQRLGGHLEEARIQVSMFANVAKMTGKTLEQYIQKFLLSGDIDFVNQGMVMQKIIDRWESLSKAFYAIEESKVYTRPFVFITNLDNEIAFSTLQHFKPAFVISFESFAYILAGLFLGYLLYQSIKMVFRCFVPVPEK